MDNTILIAPSILSARFEILGAEVEDVISAGADWIHVDVMDGRFVPNITMGPMFVSAIRPLCSIPIDVHLMIAEPERYIPGFIEAGADSVSFHAEATPHIHRALQMIHQEGKKAGVALNPSTPLSAIEYVLDDVDFVLLMTVNPGFGGQTFIPAMLHKTRQLRALLNRRELNHVHIEVDGGINPSTAEQTVEAGANILVAGSAVFNKSNRQDAIQAIRSGAEKVSHIS